MSHDRGCPCGREFYDEYATCDRPIKECFRAYHRKSIKEVVEEVFEQNKDMGYY